MKKFPRTGIGFDVHKFATDRDLILGGIKIPHTKGLLGHSDADVLLHAICDALLGAASLGDIGRHFPDTDNSFKNIDSSILLKHTVDKLKEKNHQIIFIDCIIMAQAPKLAPFIKSMEEKIAETIGLSSDDINVKATTTEKLGFTGREEGIAAQAVATIL